MPYMEISEGVYAVGGPDYTGMDDAYAYLVDFGPEQVLIDTGAGGGVPKMIKNIAEAVGGKPKLSLIVLTHNHIDHVGGAAEARSMTGAKLAVHEADAPALETGDPEATAAAWYGTSLAPMRLDVLLNGDGGAIGPDGGGLSWMHTPGHTPGSISLILERAGKKILFGQDIHGPFMPQFGSDKRQWRESMRKLIETAPDVLCEGHYGIYKPAANVKQFILDFFNRI